MVIYLILLSLVLSGLRLINQYERGIILTLGRYSNTRDPGLTWIFPVIQRMIKVDIRIVTSSIPQQEVITKDNVPVGINAVVYFRVSNSEKAILEIEDFSKAVKEYAQATLRDVIGGVELDDLLAERTKIAEEISKVVGGATNGTQPVMGRSMIFPSRFLYNGMNCSRARRCPLFLVAESIILFIVTTQEKRGILILPSRVGA